MNFFSLCALNLMHNCPTTLPLSKEIYAREALHSIN
jgi:hypothetical protein